MKKFIVTASILTIAFFVFPLSSFSQKDNDNGAIVIQNEVEYPAYIEDLIFDFGDGLPLPIDLLPDHLLLKCAIVIAPGREIIVVTPSNRINYDAKLEAGTIYATVVGNLYGNCDDLYDDLYDELLDEEVDDLPDWVDITIDFVSASLNEHYIAEKSGGVNLFFKVKDATATIFREDEAPLTVPSFNLMLKLKNSEPQITKIKF